METYGKYKPQPKAIRYNLGGPEVAKLYSGRKIAIQF